MGDGDVVEAVAGQTYIQSLARGLQVIRAFDRASPEMTLSDVARRTGLTRATARRFLMTLIQEGYVRTDGSRFALTPRILELGYSYLSSTSLPELAEPHLEHLATTVHESASVSVLDGGDIVYVARVAVSRIMTVGITIGTRFPAYCTSMGRVLLAGLPADRLDRYLAETTFHQRTRRTLVDPDRVRQAVEEVRERGWSYVDQELEDGLRSVAAPLRDRDGHVVAAMNVSIPVHSADRAAVEDVVVPNLLAAARALNDDLARLAPSTLT
jgi:IclR family pca regulon transcriptional regulator